MRVGLAVVGVERNFFNLPFARERWRENLIFSPELVADFDSSRLADGDHRFGFAADFRQSYQLAHFAVGLLPQDVGLGIRFLVAQVLPGDGRFVFRQRGHESMIPRPVNSLPRNHLRIGFDFLGRFGFW